MINRKSISKRKILRVLSNVEERRKSAHAAAVTYESLSVAALIALREIKPDHELLQGSAAIALYKARHWKGWRGWIGRMLGVI